MECDQLKSTIVNWFGNEIECHGTANSFTAVLPLLQPNGDSVELGITVLGESEWRIQAEVALKVNGGIVNTGMPVVVLGQQNCCADINRAPPELGQQLALDLDAFHPFGIER